MNDKAWWHRRCAKFGYDKTLLKRAKELYPSLFYADGGLCPADLVDFDTWDREMVHPKVSAAYRDVP